MLSGLPVHPDDRVLVDFRTSDDAGVYRWEQGPALVQTVDFFTPIVDDPYAYGQIAAANAVSDIYAMGGQPLTALAIAAFPKRGVDHEVVRAIFRGGLDKLHEAGVALLGGHTVQDTEIKFGYAVSGAIDPGRVLTNSGARTGDVLFLTKPLGTGIIATALKFDRIAPSQGEMAADSMRMLNRAASEALQQLPQGAIHACTDVTGFGLIGHASEMAAASRVTVAIHAAEVPLFPGVRSLALANRTGGLSSNEEYFAPTVRVSAEVPADLLSVLYDPQTSGGLLIAASEEFAGRVRARLERADVHAWQIGVVKTAEGGVSVQVLG